MIFNSFQFLWLFPFVFAGYYAISFFMHKKRHASWSNYLLLCLSYALYMQYIPWCALILFWVTLDTYIAALLIDRNKKYKIWICWSGVIVGVFPLLLFKYYNFIADNINELQGAHCLPGLNWAIPIGISFFSFQAIGYLIDVYKGRILAEKNFVDYALFISFFPQIMSGPISKANELLPQIKNRRFFDYSKAVQGLKLLLWGMFLKTVMADRLGLYVDSVYGNYQYQSGLSCLFASFMYTMQIYGDFAGYSLMAIGVGKLMGFDLTNNFNRPYFASSITEFWKRWHISLTRWLTTYIYIGLGGNRCSKIRQYFNIMITFLVSGIWHGANWTFILWGLTHGILQCGEKILGLDPKGRYFHSHILRCLMPFRILLTFVLVDFAWILFRSPTFDIAKNVFRKIFVLEGSGIFLPSNSTLGFMILALIVVIVKEFCEEYLPKVQLFENKHRIIRWASYLAIIVIILLCGVFDSSQFIYVKF